MLRRPIILVRILQRRLTNSEILTLSPDHMRGIGKTYEASLDPLVHAGEVSLPFYSSVTGKLETGKGTLGVHYWRKNLECPVLFYPAVMSYLKEATRDTVFVEVGPQ